MYKLEIEQKEQTIYVYLYGRISDKKLELLKNALYKAPLDFVITDVIFHIKDVRKMNRNMFCDIIDNFESMFGIKVHVLDTVQAIV